MGIEVNNESGTPVDEGVLVQLSRFVLSALQVNPMAELSLVLVDADAMEALHKQWMELPGPTDVMAFPMDGSDGPLDRFDPSAPPPTDEGIANAMLGDVVLCPTVAAEQATAAGHSLAAELQLLCTHGILHLLGYDHGDAESEKDMFDLQTEILAAWSELTGGEPIRTPRPGTGGEVRDVPGSKR